MSLSRAENLISKLISNKVTGKELLEIFEGMSDESERQKYSDALEIYFARLLEENEEQNDNKSVAVVSENSGGILKKLMNRDR